jgi:hypothetical protein
MSLPSKITKIAFWISVAAMLTGAAATLGEDASAAHNGIVLEAKNAGNYTYLHIDEAGDKFWIAAPHTVVSKGAKVSFSEQVWMYNFKSKMLKRTFDKLLFVADVNTTAPAAASSGESSAAETTPEDPIHAPANHSSLITADDTPRKTFPKAAGGYTIEELFSKKDELNGKLVKVSGEVVKVSENIMAVNWVHIQDGTGQTGSDKIIFTSKSGPPVVGAVVTAEGMLATDKNFGYGYFYPVIVEDSKFSE